MTRAGLAALLSHWRRNPLQLFTLIAGLSLATALWSGVQAVNAEARASYDAAAATLGEGQFAQVLSADGGAVAMADYVALRRAGWLVSPVFEGRLEGVRVVGLDPLTAPGGLGPVELSAGAEVGSFLGGAGQVFGTEEALAALGAVAPEKVVAPDVAPMTVLTDISVARDLLGTDAPARLLVAPDQPLGRPPLETVAPGLTLRAAQDGSDVSRLTDSFHLNLTAFGLLSFAVGLFIVHGAIGLAFEQRRLMVRTLRALGMPLSRLVWLMAAELAALALVAGGIGVALGYLIAAALLPDVAATLRGLYGASVGGALEFRPVWWLSGQAIALLGTGAASAAALYRIARMPLLAAARPRAWAMGAGGGRRLQALAGAALLALAAALLLAEGLVAAFALLAALLIGAALLLPALLDLVLRAGAQRAGGPVAGWFWADTRQQLPGLSLALMALLLAMAANVGVSTMVSSFRLTFTGFIEQRLSADLYVSATDADEGARLLAFLEPRAEAVLPVVWVDTEVAGLLAEVYGVRRDPSYPENWRLLVARGAPWAAVFAGEGTIVNEQLYRRAGLELGAPVEVGGGARLPLVGVVGDYGNPVGQVIVGEALFARLHPEATAQRFAVRGDPAALRAALIEEFGLPPAQIENQAALKAFSLQIFERTFTVTGALNVLTLAVAGFAILMSLLTLAGLRLPQLAPVWALGLRRAALGRLELVRAVLLAALTALAALPLGLALAWVLLAKVNVAAFGWRLPMYLFPADYARLGLFALVAAVLAALWPARRLARTPPAELLKVFANER
ncbi:Putative ABC transporter, fused inner membrane subunits [Oceanicola granulosus HTCC2516]|uniref:Putative ABC transporter, fused inner membrane subunits n=1 Tax=Oceanicola granulosus (strain ATCC BAA-861 / DSM 15982 / KCTC 12143 / HTCC2516) TaxID=314256 RepID=Q2CK64_OCEGH|nr:FtsX-like permease family protein [Oceanicola granulosus]EAR52925.1 Putative ABC transporter, fused inner membrane subunits [Oceanicola granulosus HTCC2516]